MNLTAYLTAAAIGAFTTAAIAVFAHVPNEPAKLQPTYPVKQTTIIYTCDNLPEWHADEQPEIRELRATCQANAEALLLIEQWQKDPQANIVYE